MGDIWDRQMSPVETEIQLSQIPVFSNYSVLLTSKLVV